MLLLILKGCALHNVLIAPRKYVQGRGALADAGKYFKILGKTPLLLWDATVKSIVGETLLGSLANEGLKPIDVDFKGDCTRREVDRVIEIIKENNADIAVGVGGGKTLDTAKAAANGVCALLYGRAAGTDSIVCPWRC